MPAWYFGFVEKIQQGKPWQVSAEMPWNMKRKRCD